jgi:nitrogen fixation NifU-like protein
VDLYREHILDHYRRPRNRGRIANPTASTTVQNPVCGDSLTVDVDIEKGIIKDLRFNGTGCAISIASASMLAERSVGRRVSEVRDEETTAIAEELGIEISGTRAKCALLARSALQAALEKVQ